jgi:pimeloyl-ACP methyl ester carboxylesterase
MLPITSLLRPRGLALGAALAGTASLGLAYRFALQYRARVGLPHQSPVEGTPADFGLPFEPVRIRSDEAELAAWWIPPEASDQPQARPAVVIVHGWESNKGRSMAHARYLHAAGFGCLLIDARGHGDNSPEELPVQIPEFAADAAAAARWLAARADVSGVGLLGHSMGGAGVIVAAASDPSIRAVAAMSSPADLVRMTRKTFEMADVHEPGPLATPLAYLTAMVMLIPRRHSIDDADTCLAASRYQGPLLLLHGEDDHGVPAEHMDFIAGAARETRTAEGSLPVETMLVPGYGHRWLYETPEVRRRIASFLAGSLGGPISATEAGEQAAAVQVDRPENPVFGFGAAPGLAAEAAAREAARREAQAAPDHSTA